MNPKRLRALPMIVSATLALGWVGSAGALDFPATGQTTAYPAEKKDGIPGAVAVPDDGTVQAGAPLSYTDNGDGTITDNNTGLMWEKKSDDGGLHDKDRGYPWSGNGSFDTVWDWLDDINAEGGAGFAGYNDWRLPNAKELQSLSNFENPPLAQMERAFNNHCVAGTTVLTGNCTFRGSYWTSTSHVGSNNSAWLVNEYGGVSWDFKSSTARARAVRGGTP